MTDSHNENPIQASILRSTATENNNNNNTNSASSGKDEQGSVTFHSHSNTSNSDDEGYDPERGTTRSTNNTNSRKSVLQSYNEMSSMNLTEVEQIAEKIEYRRANRVPVTFNARKRFLHDCRAIARKKKYDSEIKIHLDNVREYRDRIEQDLKDGKGLVNTLFFHEKIGIMSDVQCLHELLNRAIELLETDIIDTDDWLYYKDFSFDHTRVVSRWPLVRHPLGTAIMLVLGFYIFTPILFCVIMPQSNICAEDRGYKGWVDAIYFASTTISTVGYGDLTVNQEPKYASFVGSLYMILAMVVAVVAFSSIANNAFSPLEDLGHKLFERFSPKQEKDLLLYQRIRKIKFLKITELTCQVFAFILLGVIVSQIVIYFAKPEDLEEGADWSWMTSFYWSVQTVTTIGYGDLAQPQGLRYFKIFYLMIATVLVGNALGNLGSLKDELSEIRKQHAWERRRVTKQMIDEMQAYDHDDKIDQYEFLVASLVSLGKLSSDEIRPIMDKFRQHAGSKDYIALDDMKPSAEDVQDNKFDEERIDMEE